MSTIDTPAIETWDEWPGDTLVVLGCSGAKADHAAPAAELYQGSLFALALKAARALVPDEWIRVLSAKHGFVTLDQVIDPYDITWGDDGAITEADLADQVADLPHHSVLVALTCNGYTTRIDQVADGDVVAALAGGRGVGDHRHHLAGAAKLVDASRVECPRCGRDAATTYVDGACVPCRDEDGITVNTLNTTTTNHTTNHKEQA